MGQYKEMYTVLDPIIKANPGMSFPEFQKANPGFKITYWSFNNRKNEFFTPQQLKKARKKLLKKVGKKATKKVVVKKLDKISGNHRTAQIKKAIQEIVPRTANMKEYMIVGETLVDNPNTVHSHIRKAHNLKMCDANFYLFRKKFCKLLNLNLTSTFFKKEDRVKKVNTVRAVSRKKASLYTVLYERDAVGLTADAKDLITEVFGVLSEERVVNLEMVELVHPKNVIEIRSYGK